MTTRHCKRCQSIYSFDQYNSDFEHLCTNEYSTALRDEDVKVIGSWENFGLSGTEPPQTLMDRGTQNKLWGTRPWREGAPVLPTFTVRGNSLNINRTRQHIEWIDNRHKTSR